MFDFSSIQYSSEFPNLITLLLTVLCSLVLGIIIAFTYEYTSKDIVRPKHFIQALILIGIISSTAVQAIGDSIARGMGMIGALSIIRFRTSIKDTRNIIFMFAAIVVGIATGVLGFLIAILGTLGFCLTAFLLHYSAFGATDEFVGKLKLEMPYEMVVLQDINRVLKENCKRFHILKKQAQFKNNTSDYHFQYEMKLKKKCTPDHLLNGLREIEKVTILKFDMERNVVGNI